jgi:hypothetical protein
MKDRDCVRLGCTRKAMGDALGQALAAVLVVARSKSILVRKLCTYLAEDLLLSFR